MKGRNERVRVPAVGSASKDYTLNPNQFVSLNGIAAEILGAAWNGAVVLFTASVDNGTGDLILRTE